MKLLLVLFFAPVILFSSLASSGFSSECKPNNLLKIAKKGSFAITQAVLTKEKSDCPSADVGLGKKFQFVENDIVYMWLRLEGNTEFLDQVDSRSRFKMFVTKSGNLRENTNPLELGNDKLNFKAARNEANAEGNDGYFDWRMIGATATFYVPGKYTLHLTFGGKRICFAKGACNLRFEVVK